MCLEKVEAAWILPAEPRETILSLVMLCARSRLADTNLLLYIFLKGNTAVGTLFSSLCPACAAFQKGDFRKVKVSFQ